MSIHAITVTLVLLGAAFIAPAFGQPENPTPPGSFVIADQPDSPLKVSLERQGPSASSMMLKVTNAGSLPVRGYVLRVKGEERDHVYSSVFVNRFIDPGKWKPAGVSSGYVGNVKPQTVEISVDYVEFTDGSKWGPDTLGRSVRIKDYIKGHEAAKSKLAELLAGQDGGEIMKHVQMFGGHTYGEPAQVPAERGRDSFDLGYEHVLHRLRQMKGPREEEAKELARKIEMVQKSVPR